MSSRINGTSTMPHSFRVFLITESLNISKTDPTVEHQQLFIQKCKLIKPKNVDLSQTIITKTC